MKKRLLAAFLAFVLAFSVFNGTAPVEAENALTEERMAEVLLNVKGKLDIGDEFTEFDYSFNEYTGKGTYSFNWSTEDGSDRISVSADADGRILNYNRYVNSQEEKKEVMPTYIGEELLPLAEKWLYKAEKELKGKLDLKKWSYSTYNHRYTFYFVRIENGIDMNDNYVTLSMDAFDAKVYSYRISWDFTVTIPKVENPISKEKAAEAAGTAINMELQYRLTYDEEGKQKVFLAYNPDRSYVAIDAKTGKVYTEKVYWGSGTDFDEGFNEEAAESADDSYAKENGAGARLSDAEIKKIDEIKDILTSEEAVKIIKENDKLYIDPNLNTTSARLYSTDGEYFWRIYLSDNRPVNYDDSEYMYDYYRASANAYINAKTGKLISFSATTKDYYSYENEGNDKFDPKFSKKQCQKNFEAFIKETDPEKYEFVKKNSENENRVYFEEKGVENYKIGGYSYTYSRYYKDIPFYANSISGAVEAVTGKITRYYISWTDAEIPEPENIIDAGKAFKSYIACDGFDLIYELVAKYEDSKNYYGVEREAKARLVYRTAISPYYIDAFTGKQLNYNGSEYKPAGVSYKYTDIAGTKYERQIKLLADMGLGFNGEEFKPGQKITNEEFENLIISNVGRYYGYYIDEADEEEEIDPDEQLPDDETRVTRQEAAKLLITAIGGAKIAKMDIYKTGYSDEKKIDKENIGYVALCKGLGIMGARYGNKFKPNYSVTRGEAADLIIRMLSANLG